jgi:hypothetical protein
MTPNQPTQQQIHIPPAMYMISETNQHKTQHKSSNLTSNAFNNATYYFAFAAAALVQLAVK